MATTARASFLFAALGWCLSVAISTAQPLMRRQIKSNAMGLALSQRKQVHIVRNFNYVE